MVDVYSFIVFLTHLGLEKLVEIIESISQLLVSLKVCAVAMVLFKTSKCFNQH